MAGFHSGFHSGLHAAGHAGAHAAPHPCGHATTHALRIAMLFARCHERHHRGGGGIRLNAERRYAGLGAGFLNLSQQLIRWESRALGSHMRRSAKQCGDLFVERHQRAGYTRESQEDAGGNTHHPMRLKQDFFQHELSLLIQSRRPAAHSPAPRRHGGNSRSW